MVNPAPALARGRAAAEALMIDACTVTRVIGSITDPETGVVTPTRSTVYAGACKIQKRSVPLGLPRNLGEAAVQAARLEAHLPVSTSTGVQVDDLVTVTASVLDPGLPGKVFTVRAIAHKTFLSARRLDVEEVAS